MNAESKMFCECSRWDEPCTRRMTQEDFLCDKCRRGCSQWTLGYKTHSHELILFAPGNTDPKVMPVGTEGSVWK